MSNIEKRDSKLQHGIYVGDVSPSNEEPIRAEVYETKIGNIWIRTMRKIQIQPEPSIIAPGRWSNRDLDPTPPEQQTWRTWNYVTYWVCDAVSPGNLRLGSSLYSLGLSWRLTLAAIGIAHILVAILITLNGTVGARFHIPFSVQSRSSFGFYFSFVVVIVRMIVSAFWYGTSCYTGAECVDTVIRAIWPSFANIPNHLPASANITTEMMIAYIIYFVIVLPFHWIHPRNLRWFMTAKAVVCPPAVLGMLGWACNATGGGLDTPIFRRGNQLSGSALGWAFMNGFNAMIGSYGTLAVNINDFTRYARKPNFTYVQLFVVPASFLVMSFMGIVIVSAAQELYGSLIWDPLTIMNHWDGSSQARAGAAFCGISFIIAVMGENLSANCISAANDLNAMFPKYINLRRGQFIVAIIGAWALTPWNILASAQGLVNFMSGYTIWLAPMTGVLLADYFIVHRRWYDVKELYMPHGKYSYGKYGTNFRAVVAWCIGWIPLLPGFIQSINSSLSVSEGAVHFYYLAYLYGFTISFLLYTSFSIIFPPVKTMSRPEEEYIA
ncbi:MAG: hypothetical protein M1834_002552 [Cirrosporium novae-zelandiae]|nr:MAG: hypothetical protein M1834_002552 [Cirrosporium novae-zelandiae]